ncbi:hypothetical protein GXP67_27840 [Rhodocytophaga rosea]|uniref:Uncharacterized protein n=1 Tax=Rhodocytophaga rosea TaxID=2704465 RepID=A0A6C0GQ36_9BACT|nr:hypothetical protein [Rhodocytophaga rosea]QHT70185.1 hypothetical protein GXP67_27840 [Rhodocytophaga rosea]
MNNGLNYSERLEAYLRNELPENERAEFEEMMRQDPLLQNEFQLQQDIIASIGAFRKQELKERLNRIDVSDTGRGNTGSFAIGSMVVGGIAILGLAGLFLLNHPAKDLEPSQIAGAAVQTEIVSDSGEQTQYTTSSQDTQHTITSDITQDETSTDASVAEPIAAKPQLKKATATKKTDIHPVVPSDEIGAELLQEQELTKEHELVMPETRIASSAHAVDNKLIIIDNTNPKLKLQYKYADGQLCLYGIEKTYNIIDLPDFSQRYLYYEGNYYRLNKNQSEVALMPKVTNAQEIQLADSYNKEMKQK